MLWTSVSTLVTVHEVSDEVSDTEMSVTTPIMRRTCVKQEDRGSAVFPGYGTQSEREIHAIGATTCRMPSVLARHARSAVKIARTWAGHLPLAAQ